MTAAPRPTANDAIRYFEDRPLPDQSEAAYDQGLQFDVETLLGRRQLLKAFGLGALGLGLAACSATSEGTPLSSTASTAAGSAAADCAQIPEETSLAMTAAYTRSERSAAT